MEMFLLSVEFVLIPFGDDKVVEFHFLNIFFPVCIPVKAFIVGFYVIIIVNQLLFFLNNGIKKASFLKNCHTTNI